MNYDPRADEPEFSSDPHDYMGRKPWVETCKEPVGYWKNAQCGDPAHPGSDFCKAHLITSTRRLLAEAVKAGDSELIELHTDDLAELQGTRIQKLLAA